VRHGFVGLPRAVAEKELLDAWLVGRASLLQDAAECCTDLGEFAADQSERDPLFPLLPSLILQHRHSECGARKRAALASGDCHTIVTAAIVSHTAYRLIQLAA
jgi:hypothetical protein